MSLGFGLGFDLFQIMFPIMFILITGVFAATAFKIVVQWSRNNQAPRLTVSATVVAKRTHITRRQNTFASYYVTFQVSSGDRMELHVSGQEYGLLVEGDYGNLTFQGTRYLEFVRT